MRSEVLEILRCPEDQTALTVASRSLVDEVNAAVREERLLNRGGKRVEQIIDGGFVRAAGDVLYPVVDQIPILLRDEAIEISRLADKNK